MLKATVDASLRCPGGKKRGSFLVKASRRAFMGDMDTELAPEDGGRRGAKGTGTSSRWHAHAKGCGEPRRSSEGMAQSPGGRLPGEGRRALHARRCLSWMAGQAMPVVPHCSKGVFRPGT